MLSTSDLIHLSYTPDLTEGGIAYACRSLACASERLRDSPLDVLRKWVSDVAVELAFRRHLTEQVVPFHVVGMTPFTHPERFDISLGGHRCILQSFPITRRNQITQFHRDPGSLLEAPALVPVDQFAAEEHQPDELYIFAFLLGLVAVTPADVLKASVAGQPVFLTHLLPEACVQAGELDPDPKLALKSECGTPINVEIGGQDGGRNFLSTRLELPPRQRMLVDLDFHSLAYIHAGSQPEARIGIHSPLQGVPYLIPAHAWGNIWIYGMEIVLAGWLTHENFRRKARILNAGAQTFPIERTPEKNLLVPVRDLNPLGRLLDKVRQWEAEKALPNPSS